jgi:hypothetical protein
LRAGSSAGNLAMHRSCSGNPKPAPLAGIPTGFRGTSSPPDLRSNIAIER